MEESIKELSCHNRYLKRAALVQGDDFVKFKVSNHLGQMVFLLDENGKPVKISRRSSPLAFRQEVMSVWKSITSG